MTKGKNESIFTISFICGVTQSSIVVHRRGKKLSNEAKCKIVSCIKQYPSAYRTKQSPEGRRLTVILPGSTAGLTPQQFMAIVDSICITLGRHHCVSEPADAGIRRL
jgi:hypothetical protein